MEGESLGTGDVCGQSPVCVLELPKGPRGLRSPSWRTGFPWDLHGPFWRRDWSDWENWEGSF